MGHAENPIHRGTNLVAHICQKLALGLSSRFGGFLGQNDGRFSLLALCNVLKGTNRSLRASLLVTNHFGMFMNEVLNTFRGDNAVINSIGFILVDQTIASLYHTILIIGMDCMPKDRDLINLSIEQSAPIMRIVLLSHTTKNAVRFFRPISRLRIIINFPVP